MTLVMIRLTRSLCRFGVISTCKWVRELYILATAEWWSYFFFLCLSHYAEKCNETNYITVMHRCLIICNCSYPCWRFGLVMSVCVALLNMIHRDGHQTSHQNYTLRPRAEVSSLKIPKAKQCRLMKLTLRLTINVINACIDLLSKYVFNLK